MISRPRIDELYYRIDIDHSFSAPNNWEQDWYKAVRLGQFYKCDSCTKAPQNKNDCARQCMDCMQKLCKKHWQEEHEVCPLKR